MGVLDLFWHFRILSPWLLWALRAGGFAGLGLLAWYLVRSGRATRLAVALAAGGGAAVVLAWQLRARQVIVDRYPPSFLVYGALALGAVVLVPLVWWQGPWRHRVVAVLTAVCLMSWAGVEVNSHYAYFATLGDLFGRPLPNQVSMSQVRAQLASFHHAQQLVDRPVETRIPFSQPGDLRRVGSLRGGGAAPPVMPRLPTHGEIVALKIPAVTSGFVHRAEYVWLPPAWFTSQRPQLGVLVMLAGTPGQPGDWLRATNAAAVADAWAAAHQGVAPILVFADANGGFTQDTECVDGPRGRAETYLVKDVRRYVIATFGADPAPSAWGIIGLSEGGTCAADLTLRHPEAFRAFVDLAGDLAPNLGPRTSTIRGLYGGNAAHWRAHDLLGLLAARHRDGTAGTLSGWFAAGRSDLSKLRISARLARAARLNGIATRFATNAGNHSFRSWTAALPRAFAWAASRVGSPTGLVAGPPSTSETRGNLASAVHTRVGDLSALSTRGRPHAAPMQQNSG